MASGLLDLSTELLHNVLTYVEPVDLATLSQACRPLRSYINSTRLLWKELYLNRYDDPKLDVEPSWQDELQRTIQLEKILECTDRDVKRSKIEFVAEQSMRLLQRAKVNGEGGERNIELLTDFFETADNQDALLCSSSLYDRSGTSRQHAAPTPELRQFSAKLHCLFGRPIDPVPSRRCHPYFGQSHVLTDHILSPDSSPSANTRRQSPNDIPVHWVARAKVYDLRQYTEHNLWGPFMDDGSHRVDWEKVEAIMVVLGYNMNLFRVRSDGRFPYVWDTPWRGAIPKSFRSPPPRPKDDNDISKEDDGSTVISNMIQHALKNPQQIYGSSDIPSTLQPTLASLDPYGVTGTWIRVVCFLDYNDLYTFNFSSPVDSDEPRRPIDTQEGIIDLTEQVCVLVQPLRILMMHSNPTDSHQARSDQDRPTRYRR